MHRVQMSNLTAVARVQHTESSQYIYKKSCQSLPYGNQTLSICQSAQTQTQSYLALRP